MKNIYQKLFEIQSMKLIFPKTKENPFTKSKYCPLPDVWAKLEPILTERKLLCFHTSKEGILKTTVVDIDSLEMLETELHINSSDAQRMGSDITYFKRYNLGCLFNIITDDDTDAGKPKKDATVKKVFDAKRLDAMEKWAVGKTKPAVMQEMLKIQKEFTIDAETKEKLDLFLSNLK